MAMTTDLDSHSASSRAVPRPAATSLPAHSAAAATAVTVIEPEGRWKLVDLKELWRFRDLFYFLALRDVQVRYKQTALGVAWAVLQPAMMMVVFTLFFGGMAGVSSGDLPYPLFAYAGLLPWTFFSTAVAAASNSVVGSERIITKVYFPRLVIPFSAIAAAVVDFLIALGLLAVLSAWYGVAPSRQLWLAPLVFGSVLVTAVGVGTLLSALNVSYRDFRYVVPFLLQVWMFATPSVYMPVDAGPAAPTVSASVEATVEAAPASVPAHRPEAGPRGNAAVRLALSMNPMTGLIASFRAAALGGPIPWSRLAGASAAGVVCLVVGCLYFRRVEDRFADVI